jgi:hypothetical protein
VKVTLTAQTAMLFPREPLLQLASFDPNGFAITPRRMDLQVVA